MSSKRTKQRNSGHRKAVSFSLANDTPSGEAGQGQDGDSAFEQRWGSSSRSRGLPSAAPPKRFRSKQEALGAYELIAAVFACVSTIAENMAQLPVVIMRNGEPLPDTAPSRVRDLLKKPNALMTGCELIEAVATYVELCGNAYILLDEQDGNGRPRTLWPL